MQENCKKHIHSFVRILFYTYFKIKMEGGFPIEPTLTTRTNVRQATGMRYTNGANWTGSVELRAQASNWGGGTTLIKGSCDFDRL